MAAASCAAPGLAGVTASLKRMTTPGVTRRRGLTTPSREDWAGVAGIWPPRDGMRTDGRYAGIGAAEGKISAGVRAGTRLGKVIPVPARGPIMGLGMSFGRLAIGLTGAAKRIDVTWAAAVAAAPSGKEEASAAGNGTSFHGDTLSSAIGIRESGETLR